MQSTIYYLQQQLREAKETIARLEGGEGNKEEDMEVKQEEQVKQEAMVTEEQGDQGDEEVEEERSEEDKVILETAPEEERPEEGEGRGRRNSPRTASPAGTPGRRGRGRGRGRASSRDLGTEGE